MTTSPLLLVFCAVLLAILSAVFGCALCFWMILRYFRSKKIDQHLPWEQRITRRPKLRRELDTWIRRLVEDAVHGPIDFPRAFDIERAAYLQATAESAQYFGEKMRLARTFRNRALMLKYCFQEAGSEKGLILEFGVAEGTSLQILAQIAGVDLVYGFDSFEGLPEDWTHFQRKGRYSRGGKPPEGLPPNVETVIGRFEATLPAFLGEHSGSLRFAHIDCDLYSSTRTVLDLLAPRFRPGTVLLFDEYFNYPGWQHHEFKAFQETVEELGLDYEYLALVPSKFSVAVRIR